MKVGVAGTVPGELMLVAVRAEFAPHEKKILPIDPEATLLGVAVSEVEPVPQLGVSAGGGLTVTEGTF